MTVGPGDQRSVVARRRDVVNRPRVPASQIAIILDGLDWYRFFWRTVSVWRARQSSDRRTQATGDRRHRMLSSRSGRSTGSSGAGVIRRLPLPPHRPRVDRRGLSHPRHSRDPGRALRRWSLHAAAPREDDLHGGELSGLCMASGSATQSEWRPFTRREHEHVARAQHVARTSHLGRSHIARST